MAETQAKLSKGPFDVDRTILLDPVTAAKREEAVRKMRGIDSVIDVNVNRRGSLRVRYDASSIGVRDIERLLDEAGVACSSSAWWRFKSAWYRFLDGNARSNALSGGGACCNRAPTPWKVDRNMDQKD